MIAGEPRLEIRRRTAFWSPRFLRGFGPVAGSALVGLALLWSSGNLVLPFTAPVVLEALTASKGELFEDPQMRLLLEERHIRVHVTRSGSREIARADFEGYDFVFPSGRPAAEMILARTGVVRTFRPFSTPLVLATFRQYAETLRAAGIAEPQPGGTDAGPMYYTVDMAAFFALIKAEKTWDDLGIGTHPDAAGATITNGNRVFAHTSDICRSNSAESYTALIAVVENAGGVLGPDRVADIASVIGDPLTLGGMPDSELFESYVTPEGKGKAPIVVVYEHQFLAYQLQHQEEAGVLDDERVLLYPDPVVLTDPQYIVLTEEADRLGGLIEDDPALRRRAMELGYRLLGPGDSGSDALRRYLGDHGIPDPPHLGGTNAPLPRLEVLEELVKTVGGCPE